MRTIRFRGKRIDNGKWIYGDLVHDCDGKPIINIEGYSDRGTAIHYRYLVKPETVGQFTGLLDKNGKEIYEGDILESKDSTNIDEENRVVRNEVTFKDGAFGIIGEITSCLLSFFDYYITDEVVIGNIYDNPELLGGGEK